MESYEFIVGSGKGRGNTISGSLRLQRPGAPVPATQTDLANILLSQCYSPNSLRGGYVKNS